MSVSLLFQRVIFNIVNFSKTKSLYRDGMSPVVKSTSRPKWYSYPLQISHLHLHTVHHCAFHALIPNNKSATYLPCVVSMCVTRPEHGFHTSPADTANKTWLCTLSSYLTVLSLFHKQQDFSLPPLRVFTLPVFLKGSIQHFLTFSSFSKLTIVCLMFQMRGCVAGDVWSPWWRHLGRKRDSNRAVDRGIVRNAREGSELQAGQTPHRRLFIGAIFSKRVLCLLISLSLCALSAIGMVLLDTHLPSWRRRCVKDKCSPLAVCIFGCLLNGYMYYINVKIRSNPSCSMWDLLFFTYGLFDLFVYAYGKCSPAEANRHTHI